jgi:hypothetical protein
MTFSNKSLIKIDLPPQKWFTGWAILAIFFLKSFHFKIVKCYSTKFCTSFFYNSSTSLFERYDRCTHQLLWNFVSNLGQVCFELVQRNVFCAAEFNQRVSKIIQWVEIRRQARVTFLIQVLGVLE